MKIFTSKDLYALLAIFGAAGAILGIGAFFILKHFDVAIHWRH